MLSDEIFEYQKAVMDFGLQYVCAELSLFCTARLLSFQIFG